MAPVATTFETASVPFRTEHCDGSALLVCPRACIERTRLGVIEAARASAGSVEGSYRRPSYRNRE